MWCCGWRISLRCMRMSRWERLEWLDDDVFVKSIATIFRWYGKDQERVDKAPV